MIVTVKRVSVCKIDPDVFSGAPKNFQNHCECIEALDRSCFFAFLCRINICSQQIHEADGTISFLQGTAVGLVMSSRNGEIEVETNKRPRLATWELICFRLALDSQDIRHRRFGLAIALVQYY